MASKGELSRRDFLRMAGGGALGLMASELLGGCGPQGPRTPTPDIRPTRLSATPVSHELSIPNITVETIPFVFPVDGSGFGLSGRDEELIGDTVVTVSNIQKSETGLVLYQIIGNRPNNKSFSRNAWVLADTRNSTKTVIRAKENVYMSVDMSQNGRVLLLQPGYYPSVKNSQKPEEIISLEGTATPMSLARNSPEAYVISLPDWKVQDRFKEHYHAINASGTKLLRNVHYQVTSGGKTQLYTDIVTIATKKIDQRIWPERFSHYGKTIASPDFTYLASRIGVFASDRTEPGQWGTDVSTPWGNLYIYSPNRRENFIPLEMMDDGTVVTEKYLIKLDKSRRYTIFIRKSDGKEIPMSEF